MTTPLSNKQTPCRQPAGLPDHISGGSAGAAIAVIAIHFKPNARVRISLEPTPARVYSRRWEATGFRGRSSGIRGHPRLGMLRLRGQLALRHQISATFSVRPDRVYRGINDRSSSADTHL